MNAMFQQVNEIWIQMVNSTQATLGTFLCHAMSFDKKSTAHLSCWDIIKIIQVNWLKYHIIFHYDEMRFIKFLQTLILRFASIVSIFMCVDCSLYLILFALAGE